MLGYLKKHIILLFLIPSLAVSASFIAPADSPAAYPDLELLLQKGICYVTWDKNSFSTPLSDQALSMLKEMGVEYVQINVTIYQETTDSTKIMATDRTPSDASVVHAIKSAHKLGLAVMLKPHVDLIDNAGGTCWRADIGFYDEASWKQWFSEYSLFMRRYAKLAQENNVEIFCVGTELTFAQQKTAYWKDLISSLRAVYKGKMTYAANWDSYKDVGFWEDLDFVGINAYFPLTEKEQPAMEDLLAGWEKWLADIESWVVSVNKKVIFTEIGYASTPLAAYKPWESGISGNPDLQTQALCYKAFFESAWKRPWLSGVYWWKWAPTIHGGGKNNREFTPLNKPAAEILENVYKSTETIKSSGTVQNERSANTTPRPELKKVSVEKNILAEQLVGESV